MLANEINSVPPDKVLSAHSTSEIVQEAESVTSKTCIIGSPLEALKVISIVSPVPSSQSHPSANAPELQVVGLLKLLRPAVLSGAHIVLTVNSPAALKPHGESSKV